jgi:signal transduction histidine kinase/CheY-like chemotaxis protein
MTDAAKPVTSTVWKKLPRAPYGLSFWMLLMLVEFLLMVQVGKLALSWAQDMHYGIAAMLLVGGTCICGLAIFAGWYAQSRNIQSRLAEDRAQALARKAEAEAQAQQKTRLLATMSHEIRTPLNGVIGMLALLQETELNAEQTNYASMAHSSARSLLSFLDEILDTAKAEARQSDATTETELRPLMETVAELMAPRAHAKGIEVSSYVEANVPAHVPFNNLHLRQIIFNLAGNAIKFTAQGGVAIEAQCMDGQLQIAVRDTGIGMTEEEAGRVFLEYEQASDDTERRYGGTGLGLAISRRLAEAMRGTLRVKSEKGKGTVFTLSLPLTVSGLAKAEKPLSGRSYGLWSSPSIALEHLAFKLKDLGASVFYPGQTEIENCSAIICDPVEARNLVTLRAISTPLKTIPIWVLLNPEERRSLKPILDEPGVGYLVKPLRASSLLTLLTGQDTEALETDVASLRRVATHSKARLLKPASLNLLLVDDTAVNLLLASTMLRRMGHHVVTATNGPDALAAIEATANFDAVLLDVEMPSMNGHAVARRIRAMGRSTLPILALTGNVTAEDVSACIASGMNGHLAKPFDQEDLEEALKAVLHIRAA